MANQSQEMEMGNIMVVVLENPANAAVQKIDTVEQLFIHKSYLSTSLVARNIEIARLLTVITNLSTGGVSGRGYGSGANSENTTIPPWGPTGYFWMHIYKTRVGHSSATCTKRKYGHDAHLTAKRGDTQGGCEWNRTWKPREN